MNRPDLFRATIASLIPCGLDDWHVFVAVEPGPEQDIFKPICDEFLDEHQYTLSINQDLLGIRDNPYWGIMRAFDSGSELNVCLEEDFLLAPDLLQLARWYEENHKPHWACLNLMAGTCGSPGNLSHVHHPELVFESRCFNSIGVVFTRDDWRQAEPHWRQHKRILRGDYCDIFQSGWDWALLAWILKNPELRVVQPVAARCTHTGTEGINCHAEFQERAFDRLALANPLDPQTQFVLTDVDRLPPLTAAHVYSQHDAAEYMRQLIATARPDKPLLLALASDLNRRRKIRRRMQ